MKKDKKMKNLFWFLFLFLLVGCGISTNNNPPEYIKDLVVYKEGHDGIFIYLVLADSGGQMTAYDGEGSLTILGTHYDIKKEIILFKWSGLFKKEEFKQGKAGIGAFQREILAYPFWRLTYDNFRYDMKSVIANNWKGKAILKFKAPHKTLEAETTFYF